MRVADINTQLRVSGQCGKGYGENNAPTLAGGNNADVVKDSQQRRIPGQS